MNSRVVETEKLSRVFRMGDEDVRAVDGVDLSIAPGQFLAIMGPSGSGKTTLLNLIGCLDRPTSGRVIFEGRDTSGLRERELNALRLNRVGFIFQTFNLFPTMTALENVAFPIMLAGVRSGLQSERARELLSWVGLSHRLGHYPRQLSAGESQRVAVARALANQPRLVLADEPTGNLDVKSKQEIATLLGRIRSEHGTTVLMVTHDPAVAGVADRILRMVDGKLAG